MTLSGTGCLRVGLLGFALVVSLAASVQVQAQGVVVEAQAPIHNGDVGMAREIALRRALGQAAVSGTAHVTSQTVSHAGNIVESTKINASACTTDARILSESTSGGELRLSVGVTLAEGTSCPLECQASYTNKLVVTGFALEFPQEMVKGESVTLAFDTAVELARALKNQNRLLVDYDEAFFPYTSPSKAPEPYLLPIDGESRLVTLVKSRNAQYVVSGIYRSLMMHSNWYGLKKRNIILDAYVHDGANGALLAQRRFFGEVVGDVLLKSAKPIGSLGFYTTDFGQAWGTVLNSVARWATDNVACLPFMARVLKVEHGRIYLDAGAEAGLAAGNTLRIHAWKNEAVTSRSGALLGREKMLRAQLTVKTVYPGFSIAEFTEAGFDLKAQPGDLLYLQ